MSLNFLKTFFIVAILAIGCNVAFGATYVVTKIADTNDGVCDLDCSLREAIAAANGTAANDVINFSQNPFGAAQTIALGGTELLIANNGSLTINGGGANMLSVSGSDASRVFNIAAGAQAAINGMTVTGGRSAIFGRDGGGITIDGNLTLTNVVVTGNTADQNDGGGIAVNIAGGVLKLVGSSVTGNGATGSGHVGGGIFNESGNVTITNSIIDGNSAGLNGGGIYNNTGGQITVSNSTVSSNVALFDGGGIYHQGAALTLRNVTVSANSTTANGGKGGGIAAVTAATAGNTIIAGNSVNVGTGPDLRFTLNSLGHNLIGDTGGATITGVTTGNILNQPAELGGLQPNGGTTQTHALNPNSPAINAGNNALAVDANNQPLLFDQRGFARITQSQVDIGAFEFGSRSQTTTIIKNDFPDPSGPGDFVRVFFLVESTFPGPLTGSVTVTDGVDSCVGSLEDGLCDLALSTNGSRTLTATYSGDTNFEGSVSPGEPHTVEVAPPVVTENPQNQSAVVGSTVTFRARGGVFADTAPSSLAAGEMLLPGQFLISPNYGYQLIYQLDGNLVLYRGDGLQLWSTGTDGFPPGRAEMQTDGNFVVYDSGNVPRYATDTAIFANATLRLQSDGNLVIFAGDGSAVWGSNTSSPRPVPTSQWQVSTDGGANFTNIPGEVSPILTFSAALADNGRRYRAVFTNIGGSTTSLAALLTVTKAGTTTVITADAPDPSAPGQSVTVAFTVGVTAPGSGTPTGNVTVSDGVDSCTGTVQTGQCSLILSTSGSRTLTASYVGDTSFLGSVSPGVPHSVSAATPEIIVDNISDNAALSACTAAANDCSLRGAIGRANAAPENDVISFDQTVFASPQTITLAGAELTIANNGSLTINGTGASRLSISGNNASRVFRVNPGAIAALNSLTITNGRVAGAALGGAFEYGGGIKNGGTLSLTNCAIINNRVDFSCNGGGIFTEAGALTVTNSTISGNSAPTGGGIAVSSGSASLTNSTVSGNSAGSAGGVMTVGNLTLTNSTVFGNSASNAGGILCSGSASSRNSIIAGNSGSPSDFQGTLNSQGYNLIGSTVGMTISGDTTGNIIGQFAALAPLGYYGGQTMTHALLVGSPAINAGNTATSPASDQRGAARVSTADIGAFELSNASNGGNFAATLPNGTLNASYNFTIAPNNNSFTYSVSGGNLPNGLSLTTNLSPAGEDGFSDPNVPAATVAIGGTPLQAGTFNFAITVTDGKYSTVTNYTLVVLGPTAAAATISGRVLTPEGNGIRNARVMLTDQYGTVRSVLTGTFGSYRFENVATGETYVIEAVSNRYAYTPKVVTLTEDLSEIDFTP